MVQKNSNFSKFMVSARTRGKGSARTFFEQGGGVNFSRFYADVFYRWPLIVQKKT